MPRCTREECGGLVRPSIVFFRESPLKAFVEGRINGVPQADVLLVMGISPSVAPFYNLMTE